MIVKHPRLKRGGLRLTPKGGRDRFLDGEPTQDRSTILGKRSQVLLSNVIGGVEVCIQAVATLTAKEQGLRTAIIAGLVPTTRAHLRGMTWVYPFHADAAFLCLVERETIELSKGPTVQLALVIDVLVLLATSHLGGIPDVHQVLKDNRRAWGSVLNDTLGEDMIAVSRNLFQVFQLLEKSKSLRFWKMDIPISNQLSLFTLDNQVRGYFSTKGHNTSIPRESPGITNSPFWMSFLTIIPFSSADSRETVLQPFKKSRTSSVNLDIGSIDRLMAFIIETAIEANTPISINNASKIGFFCFAQVTDYALFCLIAKFIESLIFLDAKLIGSLHQAISITSRKQGDKFSFGSSRINLAEKLIFFRSVVTVRCHVTSSLRYLVISVSDNHIAKKAKIQEVSANRKTGENNEQTRGIVLQVEVRRVQLYSHGSVHTKSIPYMSSFCKQEKGEAAFLCRLKATVPCGISYGTRLSRWH